MRLGIVGGINIGNYGLYLTIFLSFFGALLDKSLIHYPFVIILLIFLYDSIKLKNTDLYLNLELCIGISYLLVLLGIQILEGKGFVVMTGGGYFIFITLLIYNILIINIIKLDRLSNLITNFFKINITILILELALISLNFQNFLVKILYSENSIPYKAYNSADIFKLIPYYEENGGLNSIYMGSQIAGMISLFSLIWFAYQNFVSPNRGRWKLWALASLVLLMLTFNGMAAILSVLSVILLIYLSRFRSVLLLVLFFSLILGYFLYSNELLFQRILSSELALNQTHIEEFAKYGIADVVKNLSVFEFYLFIFFNPIDIWANLTFFDQIFGVGKLLFMEDSTVYVSGDFGFASDVLLKCGILWALIFIWVILRGFINSYRKTVHSDWALFTNINGLLSILWLFSMLHYNQALQNPGASVFFALNFASCLYGRYAVINNIKNS